jgi:P4 family phage/plasmid primase-like protien
MKGTRELQPLVRRFIPPGRPVTIVFDAGRANNERVAAAEAAVARALLDYGCPVRVAELPPAEGGADQGPDDFLAAEGPEAMRALLAAARPAEPGQWARAAVAEGPAHARALLAHLPFAAALAAGGPGAQRDAADALKDYTTKRDVTAAARQFSDRLAALRKAGREKREGAQENGAASEIILERGDQVEIAEEHVKRIGAPVAFDEGKTFAYRGGWWRPVSDAKQIAAITTFAGALVGAGEDRRVLSLRHDACVGALKLSQALTARPGFFAGAPSGLAFQDGFLVLDGAKAKLVPHDEDHRARFAYRFAYDPGAPCPVWERYLATVWLGDDDAAEKGKALQEFVGACLFGAATTFKTTCLLYGDSDSGKSTALDVVRGVFPPGTTAAVSLHDFEQEYRRARLAGMLLNVVAEMPSADLLRSEAFKAIVAGDVIEGRRIYQEPFDFAPRAGHLFAANTLPHVSDRSGAVWARWMVISFNREFDRTGTRPDLPQAEHGLAKRILAGERPGVVAWAVRGCARLAAAGRGTRAGATQKLKAAWRKDSDPVEQWFDEMIDTKDPRHAMTPTSLYSSYQGWAGLAGYRQPVAIVTFSRTLERLLQGRTGRPAVRRTVKGYRLFVGVRIREPVLQPDPVDPDCEMDEDPLVH